MPTRTFVSLPMVSPIVPTARPRPFNDRAWLFEPKYDGFRGMLYVTRQSCTLYSKRGDRMTRFRHLAEQLRSQLGRRELILDGEIVALRRFCLTYQCSRYESQYSTDSGLTLLDRISLLASDRVPRVRF